MAVQTYDRYRGIMGKIRTPKWERKKHFCNTPLPPHSPLPLCPDKQPLESQFKQQPIAPHIVLYKTPTSVGWQSVLPRATSLKGRIGDLTEPLHVSNQEYMQGIRPPLGGGRHTSTMPPPPFDHLLWENKADPYSHSPAPYCSDLGLTYIECVHSLGRRAYREVHIHIFRYKVQERMTGLHLTIGITGHKCSTFLTLQNEFQCTSTMDMVSVSGQRYIVHVFMMD